MLMKFVSYRRNHVKMLQFVTKLRMAMQNTINVLLVDDDEKLRTMLVDYLQQQGFVVTTANSGQALDRLGDLSKIDVLILDLMLPDEDGLNICRRIHERYAELSILILSAKGEDIDRIIGLEIGADDYMAKPFNPRELVARIKSLTRRQIKISAQPPAKSVKFGHCELLVEQRKLLKNQQPIALTSGEFNILAAFATHPHKPLSREQLMTLAYGNDYAAYDRSIDVMISRLRKQIETDPNHPQHIKTVWGVGYVFIPEAEQ